MHQMCSERLDAILKTFVSLIILRLCQQRHSLSRKHLSPSIDRAKLVGHKKSIKQHLTFVSSSVPRDSEQSIFTYIPWAWAHKIALM